MLRTFGTISDCKLQAKDGELGSVDDVLFDDEDWQVRYVVVDTGSWLPGKRVLVAPSSIRLIEPDEQRLRVDLTVEQVRGSPELATDRPVSRQEEIALHKHFGWSPYWISVGHLAGASPGLAMEHFEQTQRDATERLAEGDPNLRSVAEIAGYAVAADKQAVGKIADFLIDESDWRVVHFIVEGGDPVDGRKLLLDPQHVTDIDWEGSLVTVALSTEAIRSSPAYDGADSPEPGYLDRLARHYSQFLEHPIKASAPNR